MASLTGQSWHVLKSCYTDGGPEQGFWHCLADGLNWKLGFVSGASCHSGITSHSNYPIVFSHYSWQ